jgi:PAS domain S-box-containing protein
MSGSGSVNALVGRDEGEPIDVLHVDDDASFADLTALRLARDGGDDTPEIRVETCTDPTAALDRVCEVDCIVSDFDMPELDGLELLRAVRERDTEVPFVLFTGKGSEEIASDAISAGVTDYLRKGGKADRFDMLANSVRNACARVKAEQTVEQSERRLRQILDRLPQCVFVKDGDGRYRFVNRAGAEGYRRAPEEIEGELESSVIDDPDVVSQFSAEDQIVLDTGNPLVVTEQRVTDESGERVERVVKYPLKLRPNGTEAVLGIAEDITDEYDRNAALDTVGEALEELLERLDEDHPEPSDLRAELEELSAVVAEAPSVAGTVPVSDTE